MSYGKNGNGNRIQTTVNISEGAMRSLDRLSQESTTSRSKLVDLALRRFIRWASGVSPAELKLIVDYEVSEATGELRRRRMSSAPPMAEPEEDHIPESHRPPIPKAAPAPAAPLAKAVRRRSRRGTYE